MTTYGKMATNVFGESVYGSDSTGYTAEVPTDARIGGIVVVDLGHNNGSSVWRIVAILTRPYLPRRPWSPVEPVIQVRVEFLYQTPSAGPQGGTGWRSVAEAAGNDLAAWDGPEGRSWHAEETQEKAVI